MDDGTDETLLQARIRCGGGPDRSKVPGERGGVEHRQGGWSGRRGIVRRDPGLDAGHLLQGAVPARLQLRCHKPVRRIGGIVLPERPIGMIARRFEIGQTGPKLRMWSS